MTATDAPPKPSIRLGRLVRLARPRQWVKNGFVLLPVIFAGKLTDPKAWAAAGLYAVAFVLASVAVYCLNDVLDADADRRHPRKKRRPVAAGEVTPATALTLAGGCVVAAVGLAAWLGREPLAVLGLYLGLSLVYCLSWKHQPLLDVMTVAAGFLLRTVGGAVAIGATPSPWLLMCTSLLALVLALSKRRAEVARGTDPAAPTRPVLAHYPLPLLDQLITGMVPTTLLTYMLYAYHTHPPAFLVTAVFVAYGLFRYLYLMHTRDAGEQPEEVLLTDRPTLVNLVLWAVTSAVLMGRTAS